MSDVLSQSEIDALLSAISTGEMDAEELKKEENEKKVRKYDFKRALRFSKDQIRSLSRIHENFARLLTSYFSAQLRTYVQITVASIDQLPFEEFIRSVPKTTVINLLEVPPLEGQLIIEVNPNIAYAMLDRLLGGFGNSMNKIDSLTEIETNLMKQLFKQALYTFEEAWSSVEQIKLKKLGFETNPLFLQMISPNETVIVISLSTTIGESSGMINICLPHVALEPVIQKLSMHYWMNEKKFDKTPDEEIALKKNIESSSVSLKVIFGESKISVEECLNLDVGDVIKLDQMVGMPVKVKVGEIDTFLAQPGKKNKHMAVQIIKPIEGGDETNE
ncbi:flagellar motor switch protein FliM [Terrilactibacillus sp. BCM23-1]|uniref:Flagellar motor switch protein FliM n=1 Tax=Terrilactibacillus tamarindi TaxID=2599694 RepID=A0A6N8CRF6_9BACI|nr:flagellar motor switch protein FliM [Terrilactibacillus tamarindi]MTT32270.1 flagellar motor switch protein FliM [Terrilactibacillus tamarindi]